MECNRDEAVRAKEIAEIKLSSKDIAGAKRFAEKAHNLYPGLEGISQMLATLDVYISAEKKINGESDWYGILGVNPLADEETVRKHYRKLALMLHPDKNKSVGADGAFNLISQAWSLLSDKARRFAYDQKRSPKVFQQKGQPPSRGSSRPPGPNGFSSVAKSKTSHSKTSKCSTTKINSSAVPSSSHNKKPATFWTVCHQCKMQYEYLRMYLDHNLLCPNCNEPFYAVETAPPTSSISKVPSHWSHYQQQQNLNHRGASKNAPKPGRDNSTASNSKSWGFDCWDSSANTNLQWGPFSGTTSAAAAAQAASMVQQAYERVKREREQAQTTKKREEAWRRKNHSSKRTVGISSMNSNAAKRKKGTENLVARSSGRSITDQMNKGIGGAATTSLFGNKHSNSEQGKVGGTNKLNGTRDFSNVEIQHLLMEKARKEILKKLNEWSSAALRKPAVKGKDLVPEKSKEKEKDNAIEDGAGQDQNIANMPTGTRSGDSTGQFIPGTSAVKQPGEPMLINVPDPDFHDFDRDRTERCFGANQVWAAYDDDDGMPRYYAMVHSVISLDPFKVQISWLNSKTNSELGPLNWVASGFLKTCGDFRIGRPEISNSLNSFSHKVRWSRSTRGFIQIFPKKGDVWAVYRNWSPGWNELTADDIRHKYDMVEVLEDYDEQLGVTVTPLVKVAGFKTVFHQHLDPEKERRIPKEEMFRFSHHVPSYLLTGQEAPNAPKGCRELDPAATPPELLEVITDVVEALVENEEIIE